VSNTLWIVLAIAGVILAGYLMTMCGLFRQSRDIDKKTDFSKIAPLKDEDE
jgi:hypothetical protein